MSEPIKAVLIGAGDRGAAVYAPYALSHPDEICFVAVAEPIRERRERFAGAHLIPAERQFHTWEELISAGKIADVALVCTIDHLHAAPALEAMRAGYHVMLEKPMATTLTDCVNLVKTAEQTGKVLHVGHVLRYSPFFKTLHEIIASGYLGNIITVEHRENMVFWAMAHSFVRGHWRNSEMECPIILAKFCHDLDIINWNLGECERLSSFGSLVHFRPENAPPGAPKRCTDGCPIEGSCPWNALRIYMDLIPLYQTARGSSKLRERSGASVLLDYPKLATFFRKLIPALDRAVDYRGWPISVISEDTSPSARLEALRNGPWGRCVYYCDNDVVDHQVINMEYKSGTTCVMVMHGHSHEDARTMRYDGTRATLLGRFMYGLDDTIEIIDHFTGKTEKIRFNNVTSGHGSGDEEIVQAFIRGMQTGDTSLTSAQDSLESHLMAFAAEQSRTMGRIIDMAGFRAQAEYQK